MSSQMKNNLILITIEEKVKYSLLKFLSVEDREFVAQEKRHGII